MLTDRFATPALPSSTRTPRSVRIEAADSWKHGTKDGTETLTGTVAKARGEYVRTHFKNTREVAAAISGAYTTWKDEKELDEGELEVCRSVGSLGVLG